MSEASRVDQKPEPGHHQSPDSAAAESGWQRFAYAVASGLPGIHGLYATIVPLLVYALVGPSWNTTSAAADASEGASPAAHPEGDQRELLCSTRAG